MEALWYTPSAKNRLFKYSLQWALSTPLPRKSSSCQDFFASVPARMLRIALRMVPRVRSTGNTHLIRPIMKTNRMTA